jgi:hypothetical protein
VRIGGIECGSQLTNSKHSHPATIYQQERGLQQFRTFCQQLVNAETKYSKEKAFTLGNR